MAWRFYRRRKILPGVTVNLSRSGISTSVGVKGAHITVGHGHVRETVGIPGTGVSYSHVHKTHQEAPGAAPAPKVRRHWPWLSLLVLAGLVWWFAWLVTHHGGLQG